MKKLSLILFLSMTATVWAQDIHFSQWWAAPIAMNPANTGKFGGLLRGTFTYRNQWFLIPTQNTVAPYQTYQASVDYSISSERLNNNKFGVGLMFYNDKAGDGALTTNSAMLSVAYHQSVDRYGRSHLSVGLQGGFAMKQIHFQDLIFESQLDGFGWNKNINSGENFNASPVIYPDVNVGATFSSRPKDKFAYNFGFAVHHIAEPKESFLHSETNILHRRYVVHGSCDISIGYESEWTLTPTFLFMNQAQSQQYNVGLGINYQTRNEHIGIFGGGFGRINSTGFDAAIVNLGVDVYNARLGVAYDINTSDLRAASKAQGAVEISIVYIYKREKDRSINYPMYCPKF